LKKTAGGSEKMFLNFQVKNAGFYAFLRRKPTCGQKPALGGLIDPWG